MQSAEKSGTQINTSKEHTDNFITKPFYIDEYITIEFDSENNLIYADWKGYQTEGSVKSGCKKILEAVQKFKVYKVLNDNTKVIGIWTPAAKWVGEEWLPNMKNAGLKYFAWIYSPSIMSQVSTNESLKFNLVPDVVKTFSDKISAGNWLKEMQ